MCLLSTGAHEKKRTFFHGQKTYFFHGQKTYFFSWAPVIAQQIIHALIVLVPLSSNLLLYFICTFSLSLSLRMDDQLLEVVGLYSSFHVGKIQVSVAEPVRIGQAKNIQVHHLSLFALTCIYMYLHVYMYIIPLTRQS